MLKLAKIVLYTYFLLSLVAAVYHFDKFVEIYRVTLTSLTGC